MDCLALPCGVVRVVVITNIWNMAPGGDWLQHHPVIIFYHLTFPLAAKSVTVKVHDRQGKTNMAATINISVDPLYRLFRMKQIPKKLSTCLSDNMCWVCVYVHSPKSFATLQPVEQRGTSIYWNGHQIVNTADIHFKFGTMNPGYIPNSKSTNLWKI